jgi:hypothetical protein
LRADRSFDRSSSIWPPHSAVVEIRETELGGNQDSSWLMDFVQHVYHCRLRWQEMHR